jgi:Caspase domain
MTRFVVHQKQNAGGGPAVHALVIGIGDYPHLLGGSGTLTPSHDGMGQLSSPPVSARMIADWLIEDFSHPERPVSSVALLLSEQPAGPYVNPATGTSLSVERATYDNIAAALGEWKARGSVNVQDLLIFFFCGHGIAQGDSMVLLADDFGTNPNNAYDNAIDFLSVYDAMQQADAQFQCYFVDACRASSDILGTNEGRRPLQIGPRIAPESRVGPIYYSTLGGKDAHGRPNQPSVFTEALLASFRDFGATDDEGDDDWRVSNLTLFEALEFRMDREKNAGKPIVQVPEAASFTKKFYICHLADNPRSTLLVESAPIERLTDATLTCKVNGTKIAERGPEDGVDWAVIVPTGEVSVFPKLTSESAPRPERKTHARPPYKRLKLDLA